MSDAPVPLVSLAPGAWALWRDVCLRSAGFPADRVLALAWPAAAAAADRWLIADAETTTLTRAAIAALAAVVKDERSGERLHLLSRARKALTRSRIAATEGLPAALADTIAAANAARVAQAAVFAELEKQLLDVDHAVREAIRSTAADPLIQRAIAWQNRRALHDGLRWLLRQSGSATSASRAKERLIARYLQRYCLKNESIGAVGPVGWATLSGSGSAAEVSPGAELIARREVYFEGWGIEALCSVIGRIDGMRRWIAPRRAPNVLIDGLSLRRPLVEAMVIEGNLPAMFAEPGELTPEDLALIGQCDGERTAIDLAAQLGRAVDAVDADLERLVDAGALVRTIEMPVDPYAARHLRELIARIGDPTMAAKAMAMLDALEAGRDAIHAAQTADDIDRGLAALEQTFSSITGEAATRAEGQIYAARTLVYEDTRRGVEVGFGPALVDELRGPLLLMLQSARWFTSEVARNYAAAFEQIFARESAKTADGVVSLHAFSLQAEPLLTSPDAPPLAAASAELTSRWSQVLGPIGDGSQPVELRSADLLERVHEVFAADAPGWELARYVAPDVMIAAASAAAIRDGDYQFVLGEMHLSNTVGKQALVEQHASPQSLIAARRRDIPPPCVIPVTSKTWNVQRNGPALVQPDDIRFAYDRPHAGPASAPVMSIGECVVERGPRGLIVRTRDGRHAIDAIEFFGYLLTNQALNYPRMLEKRAHTPRITIDRMVVLRESWIFAVKDLAFAAAESASERFIGARHFAHRHGLPRWVFVKIPGEQKPYFVDFASPMGVQMFALLVTRAAAIDGAAAIGVSEMLPSFEQLWLVDAAGARYTSELRMVAVDGAKRPS